MDPGILLARIAYGLLGTLSVIYLGFRLVSYASQGSGGAHVLGAALILMGFGNMQDPTMEMVQQTKQIRKHEEDDSGDPPDAED